MSPFKKWILLFAGLILWVGCSDTVSPSSKIQTGGDEEFNYNYAFLYYYYYKADEELLDPDTYINYPESFQVASQYEDIADVYYMYLTMSDLMTRYYPHEFFSAVNTAITQSTVNNKSFGMELSDSLSVETVYREGPAASAGILKGDVILSLDGETLNGSDSLYSAILSEKTGDSFLFLIGRGGDTLSLLMTRTTVLEPTVYLDSIDGIPRIRITEFMGKTNGFSEDGTALEFEEALEKTAGATATILDLRDNGGGSVELCERMGADVLSKGDTVIIEKTWGIFNKKRGTKESAYVASSDGIGAKRYYVMLLDSGSASCTEIFAAALSSNLKTPIVGENSFGKGIGQTYVITPDSAYGAATSLLFYDKDGQTYHSYGFEPDFPISDKDSALSKAVELAKAGTYKRTAGYSTQVQPYWQQVKKKSATSPKNSLPSLQEGMALRVIDYTLLDLDR